MSAPQNVVADLATFAQRGQAAASDVFESWTSTVQTVSDAAGTQASSFRRLARGMFDLADQAVVIERELATFLTVNAQVSAAALDTFPGLRIGIERATQRAQPPGQLHLALQVGVAVGRDVRTAVQRRREPLGVVVRCGRSFAAHWLLPILRPSRIPGTDAR
jgi:hypothetical protein